MPVRRVRKSVRRKRGGNNNRQLVPYRGKQQRSTKWAGFKNWMRTKAMPWLRREIPKAYTAGKKYLKDTKVISKELREYAKKNPESRMVPILADGAEYMGFGKRRGAKKIKYRRKKGRGLGHTGGSKNKRGGMLRTYRRKRK